MPKALKSCSHPLLTFADSCAIHVKPGLAVGEAKATYSSFHGLVRLQHVLWRPALQAMRGPRADAGAAGWVATCAQRSREKSEPQLWGQLSQREGQGPTILQNWASGRERETEKGEHNRFGSLLFISLSSFVSL